MARVSVWEAFPNDLDYPQRHFFEKPDRVQGYDGGREGDGLLRSALDLNKAIDKIGEGLSALQELYWDAVQLRPTR